MPNELFLVKFNADSDIWEVMSASEELEGLICPICLRDLGTISRLREHFESQHQNEEPDVLQSLKELFGKARKKILKPDLWNEPEGPNSEESQTSFSSSGITYSDVHWDPQEIGASVCHTTLFRQIRDNRTKHYALETNKLLKRLHRLISDTPGDPEKRKEHEMNIVPWVADRDVRLCPSCASSFNISRRKHHCRLCGGIMCQSCSVFIDYPFARKVTQDFRTATASEGNSPAIRPLQRRGSSNSLLSIVSNNEDPFIRLCMVCHDILLKRDNSNEHRISKPIITQMYERMRSLVHEIEELIPKYEQMTYCLDAGETTCTLREAQQLKTQLSKLAETVDMISRKIGALGNQGDSPLSPSALKVQGCVRMAASIFLRENLLALPPLPDEKRLNKAREERRRQVEERILNEKMDALEEYEQQKLLKKQESKDVFEDQQQVSGVLRPQHLLKSGPASPTGWTPESISPSEVLASEDPMVQQINIIRNYIRQAQSAGRLEEVELLEKNLKELMLMHEG